MMKWFHEMELRGDLPLTETKSKLEISKQNLDKINLKKVKH